MRFYSRLSGISHEAFYICKIYDSLSKKRIDEKKNVRPNHDWIISLIELLYAPRKYDGAFAAAPRLKLDSESIAGSNARFRAKHRATMPRREREESMRSVWKTLAMQEVFS